MGYRSEVGFACTEEVNNIFKAIAKANAEFKEFLGYAESTDCRYLWTDIKYYGQRLIKFRGMEADKGFQRLL